MTHNAKYREITFMEKMVLAKSYRDQENIASLLEVWLTGGIVRYGIRKFRFLYAESCVRV